MDRRSRLALAPMLSWLLLAGCAGVSAGDIIPDYLEVHGSQGWTDTQHPRPLFEPGFDSTTNTVGVTLGWSLTSPAPLDLTPIAERLDRLADRPGGGLYGPVLPPGWGSGATGGQDGGDDPSLVESVLAGDVDEADIKRLVIWCLCILVLALIVYAAQRLLGFKLPGLGHGKGEEKPPEK